MKRVSCSALLVVRQTVESAESSEKLSRAEWCRLYLDPGLSVADAQAAQEEPS